MAADELRLYIVKTNEHGGLTDRCDYHIRAGVSKGDVRRRDEEYIKRFLPTSGEIVVCVEEVDVPGFRITVVPLEEKADSGG